MTPPDASAQTRAAAASNTPVPPLRSAARLDRVRAYVPAPVPPGTRLRLNVNEGPRPDEAVLDAVRSIDPEALRRYPSTPAAERAFAQQLGVTPDRVLVTAGGDDAIDRLCRATLERGTHMVTHSPTFPMIPRAARLADAEVVEVPWLDGPFPRDAMIAELGDTTGLCAVVTPNNPTGTQVSSDDLIAVAEACAARGVVMMADLAYVEFSADDPTPRLLEQSNVVMIRTLSKAFGLAGLRCGYAVGPPELIGWLRAVGAPFSVSSVALAVAEHVASGAVDAAPFVQRVAAERAELVPRLERHGIMTFESAANFVAFTSGAARPIEQGLRSEGVLVRAFIEGDGNAGLIRLSLPGDPQEFALLRDVIERVLSGMQGKAVATSTPHTSGTGHRATDRGGAPS
ncbi:MAG: histidinol-phosphate transaminase [Planctomycetota bacterium]